MKNKVKVFETVADFDTRAKDNAITRESGLTEYACGCGSRTFKLLQDKLNIKALCTKCNDVRIIAWNETGHILNLKTFKWVMPEVSLKMDEK
jgi:hypothetical protein